MCVCVHAWREICVRLRACVCVCERRKRVHAGAYLHACALHVCVL